VANSISQRFFQIFHVGNIRHFGANCETEKSFTLLHVTDFSVYGCQMENELRTILLETASSFANASECAMSTFSRRCRNDSGFFARITDPTKSFTARTFDEVMAWFEDNWPEGKDKPFRLIKWVAETRTSRAA
jgi:hypothetical protein